MATRLAWLLNFDADLTLAAADKRPTLSSQDRNELIARVTDLISPDDVILGESLRDDLPSDLTVLTFCPTPDALSQISALGLPVPPAPALSVLRRVNDRAFCAGLGHGLPGAAFVRDMVSLEAVLRQASPSGIHVIKRAFSFAGREQRRVKEGLVDASTRGFCARSFLRGEGLQVEPWLERTADFSQHGYLTRGGTLLLGQPRQQFCDAMGRFDRVAREAPELSDLELEALQKAARESGEALAKEGYFGPFGIDAFRYRSEGRIGFNPRCEINARFTMGYPRALLLEGLAEEAPLT